MGTETILIAVVLREGTREGMKRMVWEGVWMDVRWGVSLFDEEEERRENI